MRSSVQVGAIVDYCCSVWFVLKLIMLLRDVPQARPSRTNVSGLVRTRDLVRPRGSQVPVSANIRTDMSCNYTQRPWLFFSV